MVIIAVELATAYISLVPSAVGIGAGIKAALAGAEVSNVAAQAGKTASGSFFSGFKSVAGLAAAAGIGVALKDAITGAGRFQSETELLVTAGGEAQSALGKVRSGIESIAIATGTSTEQLSSGMYTLEKAGIRGASGLGVLKVAAEGARAENVDLGTMTNALTSIMRSYNLPASQATQVTNELVAASGAAKTTMAEFAGSLSTVLPVASAAGLSFAQVGGAIATLTSHGTSAQEATQELANTIRSLQAPSHVASQEMAQFGLNSNTVSTQLGKLGLTGTLAELTNAITSKMGPAGLVLRTAFNQSAGAAADMKTEIANMPPAMQKLAEQFANGQLSMNQWRKEGRKLPADQRLMVQGFMQTYTQAHKFNDLLTSGAPGAQTYAQALEQMLGGATGLNTALQLTGGSSGTFLRNVDTIAAAGQKGGANISTWAQTQKNFNVQMGRLGEVAQTASINLGSALLPKLTALGSFVAGHSTAVLAFGAAFAALATAMLVGAAGAKAFALAEGVYNVLTGEATAKTGLQVVALVAQKVIMGAVTLATKAWAAAQWLLNAALEGNPIVLIVTALIALGVAIYEAYTHSKTFRDIVEEVWKAIQVAAKAIAGAFIDAWHGLVAAFDATKGFLQRWGLVILAVFLPIVGIPLLIWQHWSQIVSTLTGVWSKVSSAVVSFFEKLPGRILGFLKALPGQLAKWAGDLIGFIIIGLLTGLVAIVEFWIYLQVKTLQILAALPGELLSFGETALAGMVAGITAGAGAVFDYFTALPGRVLQGLENIGSWLFSAGSTLILGLFHGIVAVDAAIWFFFTALPGRVVTGVGDLGATLLSAGTALIGGLVHGVTTGASDLWSFVTSLPGKVIGEFIYVGVWLLDAGKALIGGFIHGIESMAGDLIKAITSTITDHLPGFVKKALGINSPSRVFAEIGRNVMAGLVAGITDGANDPSTALQGALDGMTSTLAGGQLQANLRVTASGGSGAGGTPAPIIGVMNMTAYDPAEAAQKTAAEIGWQQKTRGQ